MLSAVGAVKNLSNGYPLTQKMPEPLQYIEGLHAAYTVQSSRIIRCFLCLFLPAEGGFELCLVRELRHALQKDMRVEHKNDGKMKCRISEIENNCLKLSNIHIKVEIYWSHNLTFSPKRLNASNLMNPKKPKCRLNI